MKKFNHETFQGYGLLLREESFEFWSWSCSEWPLYNFTAQASSYASVVLAVVILSAVRPPVCLSVGLSHACFVTKPNNALRIFWYHTIARKGNHSSFLTPIDWLMADAAFSLEFALKVTDSFEKRRLRHISAYNISTLRDSEKVQPWRIWGRSRAFQRAIDRVRTLPPKSSKGGSKSV